MLPQRLFDWFHVLKSQKKTNGGDTEFNDLVSKNAGEKLLIQIITSISKYY